ncbi:AKR_collapsed_G0028130.mRNA.1.CDS.1 [Saccharomyces cerevisiae]|nr:AKR_collapsed_G0028130.mRNA.1.CDS.1 [Saccharomyces cerevisiae]
MWLLPHWLYLANVEVLAADDPSTTVHADGSGSQSLIAQMFQTVDLIYYYVGIRAEKLESEGNCCYESH